MNKKHTITTLNYIQERQDMNDEIELDGESLTLAKVVKICENRQVKVHLSENALAEVYASRAFLKRKIEDDAVIYGVNTGFGGSADVRSSKLEDIQRSTIRHLTAGMGPEFMPDKVRAAMLTRANCLAKGYSGVDPVVIEKLIHMINSNIIPCVPLRGSISASGDLMPLGYIAAAMSGSENVDVFKDGKRMSCTEALKEAGTDPVVFGPKDGLAIENATSFSAGLSSQVLYNANILLLLTQVCTGLALESLNGTLESFHPLIHDCLPHTGQKEIAKNMLTILHGSNMATNILGIHIRDKYGVLKQDRYSLRTAAQWLGPVVEILIESCRRVTIEINSANDNPTVDHRTETIVSGGNFQGETMSITMDQTRQALGICGKLLFAQFSEIVNSKLNFGLPPNCSGMDVNIDFGFKGCDIAMTSYMSELDHFVNPMSNHVLSAELHNQSVNSMALVSARFTADAVEILRMMVSNLLLLTVQAVDLRYLRMLVLEEIKSFTNVNKDLQTLFNSTEWYRFVFVPEQTMDQILKNSGTEIEASRLQDLFVKLNSHYHAVCQGLLQTSNMLGKGTQKMYSFIRNDLKIPFYCGQNGLNTYLQKIFKSIVTRDIENVLLDIFQLDTHFDEK